MIDQSFEPVTINNYVDKIIAYEMGEMYDEEFIDLFQFLINTGIILHLQGSYQRTAHNLITNGICVASNS